MKFGGFDPRDDISYEVCENVTLLRCFQVNNVSRMTVVVVMIRTVDAIVSETACKNFSHQQFVFFLTKFYVSRRRSSNSALSVKFLFSFLSVVIIVIIVIDVPQTTNTAIQQTTNTADSVTPRRSYMFRGQSLRSCFEYLSVVRVCCRRRVRVSPGRPPTLYL